MITDEIKAGAAWVAEQAENVSIRHDRIAKYVQELLGKYPLVTQMDAEMHLVSDRREETVAYFLALDSINFGSGYFACAREAGVALEYDVIACGLKTAFLRGEMNAPEKWAAAMPEQCHRIFAIPQGAHPRLDALMVLFARNLKGTGTRLVSDFSGDPMRLLQSAQGSAVALVETVTVWPSFQDIAMYKGREVMFCKRAQILAADIHLALGGDVFADIDQLTIFADNMVPHVLYCDGILEYVTELTRAINAGTELDPGSAAETEIRAAAIHAVELMKAEAVRQGYNVTSVNLDHILWARGYAPELQEKPVHRTLTAAY